MKTFLTCFACFMAGLFFADQRIVTDCNEHGLFQASRHLYECHVITCMHCRLKEPRP